MEDHSIMGFLLVLFIAAVSVVPLAIKLRLGSVIGYLVSGLILGPYSLGAINDPKDILHFAEFGVVLLLFLIGLELSPERLWRLRKSIFGLGSIQVIGTTLTVLLSLYLMFTSDFKAALIGAMSFAMSSTAIAMQIISERGLRSHPVGQKAFSILLFQDLAVIPILMILDLMSTSGDQNPSITPGMSLLYGAFVIAGLVAFAKFLSRPLFRYVASSRIPELLTALSLFIVVGVSYLMNAAGLSMALGAFMAGVILADSEYRHELEANILPFKGLLLGLFFLAVGMSIDIPLIANYPAKIAVMTLGLVTLKFGVVFVICLIFKVTKPQAILTGILLSQGGEFAFVLFNAAASGNLIDLTQKNLLNATVTLSMVTTPLILRLYDLWTKDEAPKPQADVIEDEGHPVIIAGFGRMGQIVARLLNTLKISTTVIDHSPSHIDYVRKFGQKAYYGDATQLAILESAGIGHAKLLVIAIDDSDAATKLAHEVRRHYPNLPLTVRARDRSHAYELLDMGVTHIERETFLGALGMGFQSLKALGFPAYFAHRLVQKFRLHDERLLIENYRFHRDEKEIISKAREARVQLEKLFEQDQKSPGESALDEWNRSS